MGLQLPPDRPQELRTCVFAPRNNLKKPQKGAFFRFLTPCISRTRGDETAPPATFLIGTLRPIQNTNFLRNRRPSILSMYGDDKLLQLTTNYYYKKTSGKRAKE